MLSLNETKFIIKSLLMWENRDSEHFMRHVCRSIVRKRLRNVCLFLRLFALTYFRLLCINCTCYGHQPIFYAFPLNQFWSNIAHRIIVNNDAILMYWPRRTSTESRVNGQKYSCSFLTEIAYFTNHFSFKSIHLINNFLLKI